ncbi:MAG: hypothetical protein Q8878_00595 [Bacillota bacterium]|nr:hypothetical protein [Bacillota bacterium]
MAKAVAINALAHLENFRYSLRKSADLITEDSKVKDKTIKNAAERNLRQISLRSFLLFMVNAVFEIVKPVCALIIGAVFRAGASEHYSETILKLGFPGFCQKIMQFFIVSAF